MDKGKDQTLIVKLICILLSFGLWLYISNVENPVRTYEIKKVPVELVNTDILKNSNFSVVDNQQFTVDLKLEGPSSEMSKVKKEDFKIVADMATYALREGEKITLSTLGEFDDEIVDMMSIVTIGNSKSFYKDGKFITPRGYSDKKRNKK